MSVRSACTILFIAGLLVVGTACPRPEEPAPPPPPLPSVPETEQTKDETEVTMAPIEDRPGLAEIFIIPDGSNACRLQNRSDRSEGWPGSAHVWMVQSRCLVEVEVELVNFSGGADETSPFDAAYPLKVSVGPKRSEAIIGRVRPDAATGKYSYEVKVGNRTYDPEIEIRDPGP